MDAFRVGKHKTGDVNRTALNNALGFSSPTPSITCRGSWEYTHHAVIPVNNEEVLPVSRPSASEDCLGYGRYEVSFFFFLPICFADV